MTVSVQLNPSTIIANGTSTSTATATVTDASGNRVINDPIVFTSSDPFDQVSLTTDNGDGTYTATITSSTVVHPVTITATDNNTGALGGARLTQTPYSTTVLSTVPSAPVTNEPVALIATVTSSDSADPPSGSVTFENLGTPIDGCANDPVATSAQSVFITCLTSFWASATPDQLTAVFSSASSVAGSTSAADTVAVGKGLTTTTLRSSTQTVPVGHSVTYSAIVTPGDTGSFAPTGSVAFRAGTRTVAGCRSQPVIVAGGTSSATCTVSYQTTGTHHVTATYSGNAKFGASASSPVGVVSTPLGTIVSTMQWSFYFTPSYTVPLELLVHTVPVGATVVVQCRGHGCPSGKRIFAAKRCRRNSTHKCRPPQTNTLDLTRPFRNRHLQPGARISVAIIRRGWDGKYYTFVILARQIPQVVVGCLPPGTTRPNVGC